MSVLEWSDGARTRWTSEGEGEPVLLVMGLASPSDMWSRVDPVLARSHRIVRLDETMADDVPPVDQRRMAEAVPGVELVGLPDADPLFFTDRRERTGDLARNRLACHRDRPGA